MADTRRLQALLEHAEEASLIRDMIQKSIAWDYMPEEWRGKALEHMNGWNSVVIALFAEALES